MSPLISQDLTVFSKLSIKGIVHCLWSNLIEPLVSHRARWGFHKFEYGYSVLRRGLPRDSNIPSLRSEYTLNYGRIPNMI